MSSASEASTPAREAFPTGVIAALGGIYVAQSVLGGVTFSGLPAVLRQAGLSLDQISLIFLTVIPWSFKFLWAPAVERYRLPEAGGHRSRAVVLIGGVVAVGALAAAGVVGPQAIAALMACLVIAAFATATVDIAVDGYAVESLSESQRGWGNAAQVGGAYAGAAIGGGAFLILIDHMGWTASTLVMAAVIVALCLPFLLVGDGRRPVRHTQNRPSLMAALRRREVLYGLALVALYVAGQKWSDVLIGTYLVDSGLSLSAVGVLNGFVAMGVGLAGALMGGAVVRRVGASRVAVAAMSAHVLVTAGFALAAYLEVRSPLALGALTILNAGVMALGFVALYSKLMGLASLDQAGVDFTLFQCADGLVSLVGWQLAGIIGERLGYAAFFAASAAVALAATVGLPALFARAERREV